MLPHLAPMLFNPGPLPSDDEDRRWAYEVKYDGWRALAGVDAGEIRIVTRGRRDIADELPELAPLARQLRSRRCILDAELVSFGASGRPDFAALQGRLLRRGRRAAGPIAPVALMIFDLLHLDGRDLCSLAFEERRAELARLGLVGPAWRVAAYNVGDGAALLAATRAQRIEGLVCKRLGSRYEPGRRVSSWRKIVNRERCTLVVGGFVPDGDSAAALLVGEYNDAGNLVYLGRVEHGVGRQLAEVLRSIERSRTPFVDGPRRAVFVEPQLRVEVERLAFDPSLRHARLLRFLVDADAAA